MPFANLRGLTLHYRTGGPPKAPGVVFLNSLGTDCRIWNDVVEALASRVRWLLYDQRGQGLSDSPVGPYSIEDHGSDLVALLDRVGWDRAVLCGLSIGGMIAMEASRRRPESVSGLVLADTADVIGPREFWDGRIRDVRDRGLAPIAGAVMERWFGTSFLRDRPDEAAGWANLLARAPVEGYLGSCHALRDADLGEFVADMGFPAICVCGSEDASTPPAAVRSLADRMPDARYMEVEGAGHLVPVERPTVFADIVEELLEERLGY